MINRFVLWAKDKYICAFLIIDKNMSMTFNKYILIFSVLLLACQNKPADQKQVETKSSTAVEVITPTPAEAKNSAPIEAKTPSGSKPEKTVQSQSSQLDTVTVSNLKDMVDNAKSNTVLILEKGRYSLGKDLIYSMKKDERRIIDKTKEQSQSVGGQLHFSGLDNFHLVGSNGTIIESENPNAVPLFILSCNNAKISNLTVRKKMEGFADLCYVSNSKDVRIEKCKFTGGGTYGLYANKSDNLVVNNCQISKCSKGGLKINESQGVQIDNSTFSNNNCTVPMFNFYGTGSSVTFNNVTIIDNKRDPKTAFEGSESLFSVGSNMVRLNNCVIRDNPGYTKLGLGPNSLTRTEINGVSME